MNTGRKNFIARNEAFSCGQCGTVVPPAHGTFRNHCPACLTSKHVDVVPGDRANSCHGLMPTIAVSGTDPDTLDLTQQCLTCGHVQHNRTASDDSKKTIFSLIGHW